MYYYKHYSLEQFANSIIDAMSVSKTDALGPSDKTLTFDSFGAVGDGVTDDSSSIEAAINFAQDNSLQLQGTRGKTYLITRNIPVNRENKSILDIDLNGSTLLFNALGRITLTLNAAFLTTTLTSEAARGDAKLSLTSTIGILPGDIVNINSPAYSNTSSASQRLYTLHYYVVSEVVGNDVYIHGTTVADIKLSQLIASGIGSPSLANITVTVRRPTPDVYLKNGYCVVNDPLSATAEARLAKIDLNGCRVSYLENIHFTGRCRIQIYQRNSAYTFANRCRFDYSGYISEDTAYIAPLVNGTPNGYGYGILSERTWFSKITNSGGNLCWHVFDVTEGQMHINYEGCWANKGRPGFSTHANAWHVNYIGCKAFGGGGVNGFRCHYPTVINCDFQDLTMAAFNYAACCIEILLKGNTFKANFDASYSQMIFCSAGGNPYTVSPGAISTNTPIKYAMVDNILESINARFYFNLGVDNINATSETWIVNNEFINFNAWSNTNSFLHPKSFIYDNKLRGSMEQFFINIPSTTYPVGSKIWFFNNVLQADSITQVNNAMLYVLNSSPNIDFRFKGNIVNDFAAMVRLGSGGVFNASQIEQNNLTGKLFTTTGVETVTVGTSLANIYNTVSSSLTGITITKSSGNIDRALI